MTFQRQVLHVFRKDVRIFWPALVGLMLVLAIWLGAADSLLLPWQNSAVLRFDRFFPHMVAALVAGVVLQDSPSRDTAFWFTRPIAPLAVLTAKLLFIGLFLVLLPAGVQTYWLVDVLPSGAPVWGLLLDTVVAQAGVVSAYAVIAAVSPSMTWFIAGALGAWVLFGFARGIMADALSVFGSGGILSITRTHITRLGWLVLGMGLLVYQYSTRRRRRTVAMGVAGVLLVTAGAQRWPTMRDVELLWLPARVAYDGPADVLKMEMVSLSQWTGTFSPKQLQPPEAALHLGIRTSSETALNAVIRDLTFTLLGPEGPLLVDQATAALYDDIRLGIPLSEGLSFVGIPAASSRSYAQPVLVRPRDELEPLLGIATGFTLQMELDIYHPVRLGRFPIKEGVAFETPRGTLRLARLEWGDGLVTFTALSYSSRRPGNIPRIEEEFLNLVLVNPEYGTAIHRGGNRSQFRSRDLLLGGTELGIRELASEFTRTYFLNRDGEREYHTLPDDWLEGAEIEVFGYEYAGTISRTFSHSVEEWPAYGGEVIIGSR